MVGGDKECVRNFKNPLGYVHLEVREKRWKRNIKTYVRDTDSEDKKRMEVA
jgi:hypothetical protein